MFMRAFHCNDKPTVNSVFQPSTFYDRRCKFASEYCIQDKEFTAADKCDKTLKIREKPAFYKR